MKPRQLITEYQEFASAAELEKADHDLLQQAHEATSASYAPYSHFHVAAAAKLSNGKILTGTNQENASFPAGICAERVLLSAISSIYPDATIESMAITYDNDQGPSDHPISPCGICRQSLAEYELRSGAPIRLILGGKTGPVIVLNSAMELLPMAFTGHEIKKKVVKGGK